MKVALACHVHDLAEAIWRFWKVDDLRYLSAIDVAVITLVGRLDGLAERLAR